MIMYKIVLKEKVKEVSNINEREKNICKVP